MKSSLIPQFPYTVQYYNNTVPIMLSHTVSAFSKRRETYMYV